MLKAFLIAQRFFQFLTIYWPFCWMTRQKGGRPLPEANTAKGSAVQHSVF